MDLLVWYLDDQDFEMRPGGPSRGITPAPEQGRGAQPDVKPAGADTDAAPAAPDSSRAEGAEHGCAVASEQDAGDSAGAEARTQGGTTTKASISTMGSDVNTVEAGVVGSDNGRNITRGAGPHQAADADVTCSRRYTPAELVAFMPAVELAELLGDSVLLADWRAETHRAQLHAGYAMPTRAPPAPVYEHWLLYGPRAASSAAYAAGSAAGPIGQVPGAGSGKGGEAGAGGGEGEEGGPVSSAAAYAEAVLAGLPEDDEAVVLAKLAAASGKSLQDLVDFSYQAAGRGHADAEPVATTASYNPYTRRLEAQTAPANETVALYKELSSWCDPESLERSLQEASKRKGQTVPPAVWKRLKERKVQVKKKMRLV